MVKFLHFQNLIVREKIEIMHLNETSLKCDIDSASLAQPVPISRCCRQTAVLTMGDLEEDIVSESEKITSLSRKT